MRRRLVHIALVMAVSVAAVAGASSAGASTPTYAGAHDYLFDATHQDDAGPALSSGLRQKWSREFGGTVSYPLIVQGGLYFTVQRANELGSDLYAVSARTGATLWGPIALGYGAADFSALTYENSRIFALVGTGQVEAFSLTGKRVWSVQLPREGYFTAPPTAVAGVVYATGAGSGGQLYAVNETTGAVRWQQEVTNGERSAPTVESGAVYVTFSGALTYRFSTSGALLWKTTFGEDGGGGLTSVLHGSRLWVRSDATYPPSGLILDVATGEPVGTYTSYISPSFAGNTAFVLTASGLQALNATTGAILWTQAGDGRLWSNAVVAGTTVYIGSNTGKVYGYSTRTGKLQWQGNAGAQVQAPDGPTGSIPQALQIGNGYLAVPATNRMTVFG